MHRINIGGLASEYVPGQVIAAHKHAAHQVVHALSGVMRVSLVDGVWIVPPGRALWIPADTLHAIHCIGAVKLRTIYLTGHHPAFPTAVQVGAVPPLMREMMVRIAEGAPRHQLPHLTALLIDEIATLQPEALSLPRSGDARIATLCATLLDDPADTTALTGWADRLALSPRTLMRHIQRETGMTFRELRRQSRILSSFELLALGMPVTQVALDVGFESPSAYIQAFRSVTGKTPSHFLYRLH